MGASSTKVSGKTMRATGQALFIFRECTNSMGIGLTTCVMDKGSVSTLMALFMMVIGEMMKGGITSGLSFLPKAVPR